MAVLPLPAQQDRFYHPKRKEINLLSSPSTQSGIGSSDTTYQQLEWARHTHPRKDNFLKRQGRKQFSTAVILRHQFSSLKPEEPIKTPNTLTQADDYCNAAEHHAHSKQPTTEFYIFPNSAWSQSPVQKGSRSQKYLR